ncbi:MAG TPA: nucleoside hydrolase-like domain-containing protein [Sphingomonas sp.]|nr:nucleoside hydrolase-like domain-containing protein [Sphingomonas sp.]
MSRRDAGLLNAHSRRRKIIATCHPLLAALFLAVPGPSPSRVPIRPVAPPTASTLPHRLIILSDIEADPDDTQSFVRVLLYSNEIAIEGMIATTSTHMRTKIHPDSIRRIVDAYGLVQPRLALHDRRYPAAALLRARIGSGQPVYGMAGVGPGRDTDGSNRIIAALKLDDPRPLWVAVWGGANTLAQALFTIRETMPAAAAAQLISRLRVYTISDQDDSGAWLRRTFPDLFYVVSPGGYDNGTWGGINQRIDGIDNTTVSNGWLASNIQQGHGPLGAAYPDVAYGMEGDTPSFLALIPNGLNAPDHMDWGGWGGRYELYLPTLADLDPKGFTGGVPVEPETRPIWTNAVDVYAPLQTKDYGRATLLDTKTFKGFRVGLWRWRDDFQNDFAARMRWTTHDPADANHAPVVRLGQPDRLTVRSGESFVLDASGSTDPDGDSLSFVWFHYPEAGSWRAPISAGGAANLSHVMFKAPDVSKAETAHFIVRVADKGNPPLARYARVIVTILPE